MLKFCKMIAFIFMAASFPMQAEVLPPKYVWNLGFAFSCDQTPFKNGLPKNYQTFPSSNLVIPRNYIKFVNEGDIIWVQSRQLESFYRDVFPNITHRFILLINDDDFSFPASYRNKFDVDTFIKDQKIIHIFAQNIDSPGLHNKVSGIPIGIDFHTIAHSNNCKYFGESQHSVSEQERDLDNLLSTLSPTSERIKKAYVDFHLSDRGYFDGESRISIFNQLLPTGLLDYPSKRMSRSLLWQIKGQYAFSISPRGKGLDCHRTWEDLVLGCIVIVKTSSLDELYEGLPVVIVKDWSEITPENFDKWLEQYGDAFTNPDYRERLTHTYWMNVMCSYKSNSVLFKTSLDQVIPPEIKNDAFYHDIIKLASTEKITTILEIGSSSGQGSTDAFVKGIHRNPNQPTLYCVEVSEARFAALNKCYENDPLVKCYNVSSVPLEAFPSENDVREFIETKNSIFKRSDIEVVLGWLRQDIEYLTTHDVIQDGIEFIKNENGIDYFDMVLIDGSEFTGMAELERVYGAKFILLDDIKTFKNKNNYERLTTDPKYELLSVNKNLRNGYAIFALKNR